MNTEQAIETINCIYPSEKEIKTGEYPDVAEALDMALSALRAQQERENPKPCEHCDGSFPPGVDGGEHDFRIHENGIFYYDAQFGWEGETISFCPWCGRKLEPKGVDA